MPVAATSLGGGKAPSVSMEVDHEPLALPMAQPHPVTKTWIDHEEPVLEALPLVNLGQEDINKVRLDARIARRPTKIELKLRNILKGKCGITLWRRKRVQYMSFDCCLC